MLSSPGILTSTRTVRTFTASISTGSRTMSETGRQRPTLTRCGHQFQRYIAWATTPWLRTLWRASLPRSSSEASSCVRVRITMRFVRPGSTNVVTSNSSSRNIPSTRPASWPLIQTSAR